MVRINRLYLSLSAILLLSGSAVVLMSQTTGREVIRARVDENNRVTLAGNTRPETASGTDLGAVDDSLALDHMMLQLKRSPQQEQEVAQFVASLQDSNSPNYHKWLNAVEFGQKFGVASTDIKTISGWLESHGFKVNFVYPGGMLIDFSGNAGQVRAAFRTEIHNLDVGGVRHIANMTDPQIPAALGPAIAGVVSLHDFRPHAMARAFDRAAFIRNAGAKRAGARSDGAQYTFSFGGQPYQAVVPADLATIYDINPLFAKGITGKGQTIAVIEDTNLYRTSDWTTFRTFFGLSTYSTGALTTVHPAPANGGSSCANPGVNSNGDDFEAILDAEWASATAPGATIQVSSCANSATTTGVFLAAQNTISGSAPPAIVSISYGECEAVDGQTINQAFSSLFQQAVAEGISVFVSAGDQDAASCDYGAAVATHGIGVSGWASTPYNVAVGGTDFSDVSSSSTSKYWANSNSTTYGSAIGYIPEIPWDDSCANSLGAAFNGYTATYGANGYCASSAAKNAGYVVVAGGSGGPSNCATGASTTYGVSNGTCQGWAKPAWQAGLPGIPADGVRDLPDVSLFASDGAFWGHYTVICFTDANNGGTPCSGAPYNWAGAGGTSIASPEMAGVQALINQNTGASQGNPNVVYYPLAVKVPSAFHPITQGDIEVNCNGPANCYGLVGNLDYGRGGRVFGTTYGGILSVSSSSFTPAYAATTGNAWNFATGIGSVDVTVLVNNWGAK